MTKKLQWNKNYSNNYLADIEVKKLSFTEHGMLQIINCILRTQTDEPGKYLVRGRAGTVEELAKDAKLYASKSRAWPDVRATWCVRKLIVSTLLQQDVNGLIYSPYIVRDVASSQLSSEHGKRGGNPALTQGLSGGVKLEIEKSKNKNIINNTVVNKDSKPRTTNGNNGDKSKPKAKYPTEKPHTKAQELQAYIVEVVNKCEGRIGETDHKSAALFYQIGRYVPTQIIYAKLGHMQDARNNNQNPDMEKVANLAAFFVGLVRDECLAKGVKTPIKWRPKT